MKSPEERLRVAQACLAEAGYDPDDASLYDDEYLRISCMVPMETAWRAAHISGLSNRCWPCFKEKPYGALPCGHDQSLVMS